MKLFPILQQITLVTTLCLLFVLATSARPTEKSNGLEVVYGICGIETPLVQLVLHADMTYEFIDHSHPSNKINSSGTYSKKNNRVMLNSSDPEIRFHKRWKITKKGKAKSRIGMSFYTLAKQ